MSTPTHILVCVSRYEYRDIHSTPTYKRTYAISIKRGVFFASSFLGSSTFNTPSV